ncbi:MAG: MFS transporter [Candidatus Dactylopiibacterium carminicum]|nr:MAG: MFS transporter [Candidatus Dactylopiibacterium carminicum]
MPHSGNRDFLLSAIFNFLGILVFYLLVVIIGPYAVDVLHASISAGGLAVGSFIVGSLIGRLATGQLVDRVGGKPMLVISAIAFTLMTMPYHFIQDMATLIGIRLLHGIALGVAGTAVGSIMAYSIPPARKGEGVGYFSLSTTFASAIGPFLGLFLMNHAGFGVIFIACSAASLLACLCALPIHGRPKQTGTQVAATPRPPLRFTLSELLERKAVPIALITFLASLCYAAILAYLGAFSRSAGLSGAASFFFVAYSVVILISRPFVGRLLDRRGANPILPPCLLLLAAGMLLVALAQNSLMLLAATALIGLGFGNIQSVSQAVAIKMAGPTRMGLATSTWFIFLDAGLGFGPYFLGLLVPHTGFRALYGAMAVLALLTLPAYWYLHGRKEARAQTEVR